MIDDDNKTFKIRSKMVEYEFDIGDDYTLMFSISRTSRKGDPGIEVDLSIVENILTYEQMSKMVQIIAEEAYKLGKEGGNNERKSN